MITNDVKGLSKNAHLHLTVWDYDVHSEDDLIGGACIAWADILEVCVNLYYVQTHAYICELSTYSYG